MDHYATLVADRQHRYRQEAAIRRLHTTLEVEPASRPAHRLIHWARSVVHLAGTLRRRPATAARSAAPSVAPGF